MAVFAAAPEAGRPAPTRAAGGTEHLYALGIVAYECLAGLRVSVTGRLELPHERLTWECEQAVRSYDPCISCAAHFPDLRVQRT